MRWKELFLIFLPITLIVFFVKTFLGALFLIYPGDMLFALAIATISVITFSLPSAIFLFFLGLLKGIDTVRLEPLWAFFFLLCMYFWNYIERFFALKELKMRLYAWLGYCIAYGILQFVIYFSFLQASLGFKDIFILFLKGLWVIFTTYLWILFLYKVLRYVSQF
jgi:hypothetical protein